mgnify:CR=1 FL=1
MRWSMGGTKCPLWDTRRPLGFQWIIKYRTFYWEKRQYQF